MYNNMDLVEALNKYTYSLKQKANADFKCTIINFPFLVNSRYLRLMS